MEVEVGRRTLWYKARLDTYIKNIPLVLLLLGLLLFMSVDNGVLDSLGVGALLFFIFIAS